MYFKRIDMHGFKSFAEPVSVDFHKGITCIVGPNGSGKSNISDAIRWVLGEQSPKMLRGGKMEEVIFSGTENRKSRGMAEVTLVLDNQKGMLPIDYSEVAITRRMYRSGESEYSINNHACRLKDIRELIMDTGIGVDGYSIIGQGKISDIVGNKPESRREIFEEAAGIVKYKSKKAEAEKKLESTNYNLERVNDIVYEIESRIDNLKTDSENAKEFLDLRERLKTIEINTTLKNIEAFEQKNEVLRDDLIQTSAKIDESKDAKNAIDEEIKENQLKNDELEHLGTSSRDELLKQVEDINILDNKNQINNEKIASCEKDILRITSEIQTLEDKHKKEAHELSRFSTKENSIKENLLNLNKEQEKLNSNLNDIQKEIKENGIALEEQKNKIYQLHNEAIRKNNEVSSYANITASLSARREQIKFEEGSISSQENKYEEELEVLNSKSLEITIELDKASAAKSSKNDELEKAKTDDFNMAKTLENLKLKINELSTKRKFIEEMENSYEGYNNAVKFIMRNKSSFSGIKGTVADLIEVPIGYEQAIEAGLSTAMQNIICIDDASAKDAIRSLKENKAGRLTFLPIGSIRANKFALNKDISSSKGFIGVAAETVSYDKAFTEIFQYLLGRVVLVDNIDNAISMSKLASQGLRFVTLEGEIINSSGAITGGAIKSNAPGLLERKGEIKKLEESLIDLIDQREKLIVDTSKLKELIITLSNEVENLSTRIQEVKLGLSNYQGKINQNQTLSEGLKHNISKLDFEIKQIEKELENANDQIQALKQASKAASEEAAKLELEIESESQMFEEVKIKGDEAIEALNNKRIEIATCDSELASIASTLEKAMSIVTEINNEKSNKEELIFGLESRRKTLQDEKLEIEIEIKKLQDEKLYIETSLRNATQEKELIVNYLKEIQSRRENLEGIINTYQDEKFQLELKLAKNESQIDAFKDRLWDEFEISYIQAIEYKKTDFSMAAAQREIRDFKARIKELGEINVGAIKEYETTKERYDFLTTQRKDLIDGITSLRKIIEEMDKTIKANFKISFEKIAENFQGAFTELFGGGSAKLRLEDETKPLECGIEIVAQPPGKKLQNINLLSGGEKTMTAIALMFAVLKAKPTPFCILDEVEAALDDSNINRFAEYLKNFKEIQFALVTHQKATMEYADVLYGVTMPERGISKILSLKLGNLEV